MQIFYRCDPGPPNLRNEMTLAGFDMASIDRDCGEIGCTLEAYMEGLMTRPGGVCDRLGKEPMTAADIAGAMRLSREWDNMNKFFDQLDRAEVR